MGKMRIQLEITQLNIAYASGQRQFSGIQLPKADLRGMNLSGVDFTGADLSGADLREANLERANFQGANLQSANLSKANGKKASFEGANLKKAYLTLAELREVNLMRADLEKAYCNQANMDKALLDNANLQDCFFIGTSLKEASLKRANLGGAWVAGADLERANLAGAFYNDRTRFDEDFNPISAGLSILSCMTTEDIVPILSYIYQSGCKYLGKTIASKYWQSTCPSLTWLEQFPITASSEIGFAGEGSELIEHLQLEEYREWMNRFTRSCGSIVRDFTTQLEKQADDRNINPWLDILR
jgi:uncharacterized protein YjbI with pentapeptide repeats